MKPLSQETVSTAVALLNNGESYAAIARMLGISKKAVNTIKNKHLPGHIPNKGGRPQALVIQDERCISRKIASGVVDTAVAAAKMVKNDIQKVVSADTVRRSLKRSGMRAGVKVKKPLLGPR
ncbi:hypothetical protein BC937DRAFT_91069, partial [Endogone sp. FLAS-F59071]